MEALSHKELYPPVSLLRTVVFMGTTKGDYFVLSSDLHLILQSNLLFSDFLTKTFIPLHATHSTQLTCHYFIPQWQSMKLTDYEVPQSENFSEQI
jgi:hypothetical protein